MIFFVQCARLGDFKDTPSSRLTIDEFLKIDLEQEHDPPCFLEAKKRSKQQQIAYSQTQGVRYSAALIELLYWLMSERSCLWQSMPGAALLSPLHVSESDNSLTGEQDCQKEMQEEENSHGFGGIKMKSVQQIIAKARVAEAFLSIPTAGLGNNLHELANFVEDDDVTQEAVGGVETDKKG